MDNMTRQVGHAHPRPALPPTGVPEDLNGFLDWLGEAIPLVGSLGIQRMREEGNALVWELDLRPNLNDKGTGFGGSLTAQTTLLGWCWTTLWLRRRGINQDVVVAQASQRFVAPVTGDYCLICRPEEPGDDRAMLDSAIAGETSPEDALERRLAERGKGRIALFQELWCGETLCLEARGDYAVLPSEPPIAV